MNRTIATFAAMGLMILGCAWFQKNEALFPSPAQVACVLLEVEGGKTDPIAVAIDCGIDATLIHDVEILINGGLKAKAVRAAKAAEAKDAGAEASK